MVLLPDGPLASDAALAQDSALREPGGQETELAVPGRLKQWQSAGGQAGDTAVQSSWVNLQQQVPHRELTTLSGYLERTKAQMGQIA